MKLIITYILLIAGLGGLAVSSCGKTSSGAGRENPVDTSGTAVIKFDTLDHNFGAVKPGEKIGCIFKFTNTGDADLVVTAASASCGCTVPKFSKKPVAPGEGGTIEVIFDTSGREGLQTKTVVVQSNAENNLVILRIMADIINRGTNK
ncbi:MAG: DUF1573 domain-containing protein [Bacteroidales bacterium]|nr:DUF1573 domain-containing protein [Bacteroidales bacterium]